MAKILRDEWKKALTYEKLMQAHKLSKKGKGYRKEVILFELKKEEYIKWLFYQLKEKEYRHGSYTIFYVLEPKLRRIEKSRYIDRIVHRWVVDNFLIPYFVPTFCYHSYACLKEKGMHRAALYVQECMRKCRAKWGEYYILKMDVAKYFQNISKEILFHILEKKIQEKEVLQLLNEIIYSNGQETGLPIGNYTSQMFANIYLNEMDRYIKETLKVKFYCRYMDDSTLMVQTKQEAKELLEKIKKFLEENLQLELNQKTQIFKGRQGVNFCGYQIKEYQIKLREKGKQKLKRKIRFLTKKIQKKELTTKEAKKYLAGHMGYIKYANCEHLIEKIFYQE